MRPPVDVSFCDVAALTRRCEEAWGRPVDPYAAAYLARIVVRLIAIFSHYMPPGTRPVHVEDMYHAAAMWFD